MPTVHSGYRPDPRYAALDDALYDPVEAAKFPAEILRWRNDRAAAMVGLDKLTDAEWLAAFARFEPLPDNMKTPLAMRYHGHQFRSYNPDIGDGRGFLFAQLREHGTGRLLDLGTKGSGQTPWSRFGDGRLTLKGGVREILAAEMLEALGVPTSRAFSLVETGEALTRGDEPSPTRSSVLTRLSYSHVRFGTFQRLAYFDQPELMKTLFDHVVEIYHPDCDTPAALLAKVTALTAHLTARWMSAGFVHGVLNTDNMNITGESFDYGPWRFLPRNDPNFIAAYFDQTGLYAFGRQPEAAFWNLQQLAAALTLIEDQDALVAALNTFSGAYVAALSGAMVARLGLKPAGADEDSALANAAFGALAEGGEGLRWEPFFFDWFGGAASSERALKGPRGKLYDSAAFKALRALFEDREMDRPQRLEADYFDREEPEEMLIDEVEALWAHIDADDDWTPLMDKVGRVRAAGAAYGIS